MNILQKLELVREEIRLKKDGSNDFQKYKYFTPDLIIGTVNPVLKKHGLIALFNMQWNPTKDIYEAELVLHNIANDEALTFHFDIKLGIVKGANESQSSGSTLTYAKRYSYMNAFDIIDNRDDPDSNDVAEKVQKAEKTEKAKELQKVKFDVVKMNQCKTVEELQKYYNSLNDTDKLNKVTIGLVTELKGKLTNG